MTTAPLLSLSALLERNPRSAPFRDDIERAQEIVRSLRQMGIDADGYGLESAFGDKNWLRGHRQTRGAAALRK